MSAQPPGDPNRLPPPGSLRCPRCSATVGADQDWCLECGAPARTRLAPTPNWQLPTVAIAAMVLLAGALLAFAFVDLTGDDGVTAGTTPTAVVETAPPAAVVPAPVVQTTATSTAPVDPAVPSTVPGQATTLTAPAPATTSTPATTGTTATGTATTKR
ncbi:MAG TPA: hypothetical protein VNA28_15935 [Solirubrobacteraceae bacterium]|nr:hypothetical protein [Solirubrobacteraceae bacterium]